MIFHVIGFNHNYNYRALIVYYENIDSLAKVVIHVHLGKGANNFDFHHMISSFSTCQK